MAKYYIYTLKLEGGKYYVGATSNLTRRFRQHCSGKGANFTRKYKPLYISSFSTVYADKFDDVRIYEDARAIEAIFQWGIENARGGRFFSPNTKRSTLNKNYEKIPDTFKNIPKITTKAGTISLTEVRQPKKKTKKHKDIWSKQVAKARHQLWLSSRRLEGIKGDYVL